MMVRTVFQPRQALEVPEQEAQVLEAQGLLWSGSDADLEALLASDPVGPLSPPRITVAPMPMLGSPADAVPMPTVQSGEVPVEMPVADAVPPAKPKVS